MAKYVNILIMKGIYPIEYFNNPNMDKIKSIEEIWDDIDAYSGEYFEGETYFYNEIDAFIPLPPLFYKGKFTKGIIFSQALEYLLKLFPDMNKLFHTGAYTMWSSYSWCDKADFYLACYENKPRENYHKSKYQNKKDIIFVPLQDADYTDEYLIAPTFPVQKNIDVLCISTPAPVKNLDMLASALKAYKDKYGLKLKTTIVLGDNNVIKKSDNSIDYSLAASDRKEVLDRIFDILKEDIDMIDFIPYADIKEITKCYTNSKCLVLNSLIEGKNRSINEAMSCNTPVIVFKDHNKWARGGFEVFPENSGEYVEEFSPEALADTIHYVLSNQEKYHPRENYLRLNGRKNFIDKLVSYIPYYKENIPEYSKTKFHENLWIDLACQANYQLSYIDFLYDKNPLISHIRGLEDITKIINFFYLRFNI